MASAEDRQERQKEGFVKAVVVFVMLLSPDHLNITDKKGHKKGTHFKTNRMTEGSSLVLVKCAVSCFGFFEVIFSTGI